VSSFAARSTIAGQTPGFLSSQYLLFLPLYCQSELPCPYLRRRGLVLTILGGPRPAGRMSLAAAADAPALGPSLVVGFLFFLIPHPSLPPTFAGILRPRSISYRVEPLHGCPAGIGIFRAVHAASSLLSCAAPSFPLPVLLRNIVAARQYLFIPAATQVLLSALNGCACIRTILSGFS